ncbi:DNA-formamidopyrimidine glycosylase family protein [Cellulomonas endophytica]|uniref:DNA-formamidopyrimidine glycosylase family protein n=1 Tax=Cellulomonas endophytica TaxID=2494735 RepID=UPI001013A81C|nr:DNA-formamidopyrimidine glycosylase family protein [Cellulomonas endophytica]
MPEGDVLRRTGQRLDLALAGQGVVRTDLRWPSAATATFTGATVVGTRPYGKHLLTRFSDGRTLHTHLRMDGSWRIVRTGSPEAAGRSPRVRAVVAGAGWTALGLLLGMLDVVPTADEGGLVGHLGPDVLDDDFLPEPEEPTAALPRVTWPGLGIDAPGARRWDGPGLAEALRRWEAQGRRPVAEVLLDQTVVAGLGTVYMAESLFARRVWPWTPARDVPEPEAVLRVARLQMRRSVVTGDGPGRVHARAGAPCTRCRTPLLEGSAGVMPTARPVTWCPRCQADPEGRAAPPTVHRWARTTR